MGNCLSTSFIQEHQHSQYPRNKVVPHPTEEGQLHCASQSHGDGGVNHHANPQCNGRSHSGHGAKERPQAALDPQLKQLPQLQQLLHVCSSISADNWSDQSQQLRKHAEAATAELQAAQEPVSDAALSTTVHMCTTCLQAVLGPVAHGAEQLITDGSAGKLTWDSATPSQVISAVAAAAQAAYPQLNAPQSTGDAPSTLAYLGSALKPLVELLSLLQSRWQAGCYPQQPHDSGPRARSKLANATAPSVPALDVLVSAFRLVLYKRVALESQAHLESKARDLQQLSEQLGWTQKQLSACCSAPLRAMLLSTYMAAACQQGEQRVKLKVRRSCAFWDALKDLEQQGILDMLHSKCGSSQHLNSGGIQNLHTQDSQSSNRYRPCKIFPSFLEEWGNGDGGVAGAAVEAGEGHGPRKEFFILAAANAAGQQVHKGPDQQQLGVSVPQQQAGSQPPLLVFNRDGGVYWYNTQLVQTDKLTMAYACLGWMMGQSLYNHAHLGLPLSPIMMLHLLQGSTRYKPSMQDLQQFDPDAAAAISKVASLPAPHFASMLELEGLPSGLTAEQYISRAVSDVLLERIAWQAEAVSRGFWSVIDVRQCEEYHVGPAEIAAAIGGHVDGFNSDQPLNIQHVFRVVMDEELESEGEGASVGAMLWQVLLGWPRAKQLQFIEFVTGTSRLPLPGTELLKVECPFVALNQAQHTALLQTLPQAHTCDNLLELPNYWAALLQSRGHYATWHTLPSEQQAALQQECRTILEDRLTTAVTGCFGYALDERS